MVKESLFKQPGVESLMPGAVLPVAVRVTGRNMGAVTLLLAVSSETAQQRTSAGVFFEKDGSLSHVEIHTVDGVATADKGNYLLLSDDEETILVVCEDEYNAIKSSIGMLNKIERVFGRDAAAFVLHTAAANAEQRLGKASNN